MHRFYSGYGGGPGMMLGCGGLLIGLVFLVVIGLVIHFMVKNNIRGKESDMVTKKETPLEVIKRRYANGEINQEEFKNMRKELQD